MELTKKQIEFWTAIVVLCLITAVAVMLVDFSIKASILEESLRLRETIEGEEVARIGRKSAGTNAGRDGNDTSDHTTIPGAILVDDAAGMETENAANGAAKSVPNTRKGQPKPRRQASPRTIQDGN